MPESGKPAGRVEVLRRIAKRSSSFWITGLALVAVATGPARGGLVELAAALDRPVAGSPVATPAEIAVGRARFVPGAAASVRPLFAGDERCGLWIDGPGELRYAVTDLFSVPVAKRNLKSASSLEFEASASGLVVREAFDGAVIWGWDVGVSGEAGARSPLPAWASTALDRAFVSPPAHDLLSARATGTTGVAYALVHGRGGDLLLSVDPTPDARIEVLYRFKELPRGQGDLSTRTRPVTLVAQPVARAWAEPTQDLARFVSGDVTLTALAEESARIEARLGFRTERPGLTLLRLSFADTLYDDEGHGHRIQIESISVDGKPAATRWQGGELLVELPAGLPAGATVELAATYSGLFTEEVGGNSYWSQAWDDWLPMPASLSARHGSWHLTVRSPAPFVPYASGETVALRQEGSVWVLESRLDGPFRSVAVGAGKYDVEEVREGSGPTVRVASYVFAKQRQREQLANNLLAAQEYFSRLFGAPFPYREIDVVEVNSWGFGMAPPGVIFITREAFDPAAMIRLEGAEGYSRGTNGRFVHEVAHAWWGNLVEYPSGEEQWLSESFADYSAALCLEAMRGGGRDGQREFRSAYSEWKSRAGDLGDGASLFLANRLAFDADRDAWERTNLLYNKGPLVIHAIRRELARLRGGETEGDRYFFAFLKTVIKNFAGKPASTRHLAGILGQMTGADWRPFFDRYVYGTEMPPLE